jgi:tetratricopeptide (TPR) repeat protein
MAKRKADAAATQTSQDDTIVDISQVGSQAGAFWDKYGKMISIVGGALLLLVGGYFIWKYMIQGPKQKEAITKMYAAEGLFERDSFDLALNSPDGFLDIANNYGSTPAGNSAKFYAGACYLNLGQFEKAVEYFSNCKGEGTIMPIMRYNALGDAYSGLNQLDKAAEAYDDAIGAGSNAATIPMIMKKLAMLKEKQGDKAGALKLYEGIKEKYFQSVESTDIDKYIIRAGGGQK